MDHHWLNIKEKLKKWKRYVKKGLISTNIAMWSVGFTDQLFYKLFDLQKGHKTRVV